MEEVKIGRYRHFKGGEYEVLFLAKHSETCEPLVVYRALYGERAVWVRPLSMCGTKGCIGTEKSVKDLRL